MHPRELVALLKERPFQPLRIALSDGESYVVQHPELAIVDPFRLHLGLAGPKGLDEPVERTVHITLLHIVRAEHADRRSSKRGNGDGKRKK
jgi:hypothetical protein